MNGTPMEILPNVTAIIPAAAPLGSAPLVNGPSGMEFNIVSQLDNADAAQQRASLTRASFGGDSTDLSALSQAADDGG